MGIAVGTRAKKVEKNVKGALYTQEIAGVDLDINAKGEEVIVLTTAEGREWIGTEESLKGQVVKGAFLAQGWKAYKANEAQLRGKAQMPPAKDLASMTKAELLALIQSQ